MYTALRVGSMICLSTAICWLGDVPASSGSSGQDKKHVSAPTTLEEGFTHLEKVLGRYDPDDQLEWHIPIAQETKQQPDPAQAAILLSFKGSKVIGMPFRSPESISFDEVMHWDRHVYDLVDGKEKALTRFQRSHNVTRFSLSLVSGVWLVHGTGLSNGVHTYNGRPVLQGTVKWLSDGFEFVGFTPAGRYYGAGGQFILGAGHGKTRYLRRGDRLHIDQVHQSYHLAMDPEGNTLSVPDFKRPFGKLFVSEFVSEPAAGPGAKLNKKRTSTETDGVWKMTNYTEDGKPNEAEVKANHEITRKNGVQRITMGGRLISEGRFELDAEKSPKQIEFIDATGRRTLGIYEVNGDKLRIGILSDEKKRSFCYPSVFGGEGTIIAVYERALPTNSSPVTKPARVEPTAQVGEFKGTVSSGIYELNGIVLRWCQSDDSKAKDALKGFRSPEGSKVYLSTFKRGLYGVLAARSIQDGCAKEDLDKLQGTWKVDTVIIEGEKVPAKDFAKTTYTFKGECLTISDEEGKHSLKIKLDPDKKPPAVDMIDNETNFIAAGIYRLEADTLTMCWYDFVKEPRSRPKELKPNGRGTVRFLVLKREKK